MAKNGSKGLVIVLALLLVAAIGGGVYIYMNPPAQQTGVLPGESKDACAYSPALTYNGYDAKNTGTLLSGTNYIKVDGGAPVSTYANGGKGQNIQFILSNSSLYCEPTSKTLECSPATIQSKCYFNSTPSLTAQTTSSSTLTAGGGATNLTVAASGVANMVLRYQGVAKKSAMPYGGLMVVEVPSTISGVTVNGENIVPGQGQFHLTHSVTSTGNIYFVYTVPASFDDASGAEKVISFQFSGGSTDPTGKFYVQFYPANYYITNNGDFTLDTEKFANSDTTKVGITQFKGTWGMD